MRMPANRKVTFRLNTADARGHKRSYLSHASNEAAALRPSAMAQTIRDCPRRMSPAANTPGTDDM